MKRLTNIIGIIVSIISVLLFVSARYFEKVYGNIGLDEMLYYLGNGLEGGSLSVVYAGIKSNLLIFIVIFIIVIMPYIKIGKKKYFLRMSSRGGIRKIKIYPFDIKFKWLYSIIIFALAFYYTYDVFKVQAFMKSKLEYSTFIEENYVSPSSVQIDFPQQKRNLIVLYLESFETTMMSRENGGGWEYSVVPELEQLALNNINFSNTNLLGGPLSMYGTDWTIAGLVSYTAGIPLKIPVDGNSYVTEDGFLNGVQTLGDILKNEGYNLEFIMGSDATFGGRKQYFEKHGNHIIYDLNYAVESGKMSEDEKVFWGYEDKKLFEWAKEETLALAAKGTPFNLNLLTVNTHFEDGYLEAEAENLYPTQYENVHAYSSKQIIEFIEWLKEQPFYDNTTLVLLGDHNSMQSSQYYEGKIDEQFSRTAVNVFVNSVNKPINEKSRVFSSFDMFPTILSSIGVTIEGNKLGLGVDLFSDEPTLLEKQDVHYVNGELAKNSEYYNEAFLGDHYLEMMNSQH